MITSEPARCRGFYSLKYWSLSLSWVEWGKGEDGGCVHEFHINTWYVVVKHIRRERLGGIRLAYTITFWFRHGFLAVTKMTEMGVVLLLLWKRHGGADESG